MAAEAGDEETEALEHLLQQVTAPARRETGAAERKAKFMELAISAGPQCTARPEILSILQDLAASGISTRELITLFDALRRWD